MRKLPAIDSIRGLSALWVFVAHFYFGQFPYKAIGGWQDIFLYGRFGVVVFIALSGFCLGLTVHRVRTSEFLKRRCWRLLPPYYAALAISMLICQHALSQDALIANLFLLIDLDVTNARYTNYAFWTIGIELRLTFLLPLFALIFQRWGAIATIGSSVVVAWLWRVVYLAAVPGQSSVTCSQWFVVIFVMGYLASRAALPQPKWLLVVSFVSFCTLFSHYRYTVAQQQSLYVQGLWFTELALGVAIASWLMLLSRYPIAAKAPLQWFGSWSYSLYLVHLPLMKLGNSLLQRYGITGWNAIALGTIPILSLCYLFSLVFERPFQRRQA